MERKEKQELQEEKSKLRWKKEEGVGDEKDDSCQKVNGGKEKKSTRARWCKEKVIEQN